MKAEIEALGLPKPQESAAWEARAQITWGEPQAEVRRFLLGKGFADADANHLLTLLTRERDTSIRKMGILDTAIGSVLLLVTIPGLVFFKDGVAEVMPDSTGKCNT